MTTWARGWACKTRQQKRRPSGLLSKPIGRFRNDDRRIEEQAAGKLVEAANLLSTQGSAMQLRYLQTLTEIAGEKSSTIVFPLPVSLIEGFEKLVHK